MCGITLLNNKADMACMSPLQLTDYSWQDSCCAECHLADFCIAFMHTPTWHSVAIMYHQDQSSFCTCLQISKASPVSWIILAGF